MDVNGHFVTGYDISMTVSFMTCSMKWNSGLVPEETNLLQYNNNNKWND